MKYIEMMVNGLTLPKIAEQLNIHIFTAFYWRHKVLNALGSTDLRNVSKHRFGKVFSLLKKSSKEGYYEVFVAVLQNFSVYLPQSLG